MAAYLTGKKLGTRQWYETRNRPLTGCTMLHTSEGVLDTVGPDTGAEALAEFIRTRTTAGSYHDIADSDSWIHLVEWDHGAFHDGTGSNNWALSLSFACRTTDWRAMPAEKRRGFLRNGARAFLAQQDYRRSIGAPLTELRLITKAQSDRGESGFTYHGWRDPGRRSDPGVAPPNLFPFDEFIAAIRAEQAGTPTPLEDDMPTADDLFNAPLFTDNAGTPQARTVRLRDLLLELRNGVGDAPGRVWAHPVPRPGTTPMPAGELLGFTDRAASLAANTAATAAAAAQRAGLSDEDVRRVAEAAASITADEVAAQLTVVPKPTA